MEIEGCQEFDLEFEDHDLIDNDQFPETMDGKKAVNSLVIDVDNHSPELCGSTEPERKQRNGRYNLRKSLAWDSAFFTSAGVLDAEELSSMITGSDKKKKHALPGIQEEISGSTESISTLQSDSLTLETLDDDLFLDIRASIQRSSKKASNLTNSSSKIAAMELVDSSAISTPKKEDIASQNKNPKPGVKETSNPQAVRMSKSQLKPTGKPPGRPIKQASVQSQTGSIHKTRDTSSILPVPVKTVSSSVPSTAAKRNSVGTGRVKPECGSSKQGPISSKGTRLPKVSTLSGSRKVFPEPAVSLKTSFSGSSITSSVCSTRSSTSSDSSINASSGNSTRPTLMTARRNLVKNINISTGSSGAIPKTSKTVAKNKLPASTLSSYLKSTKISTSVSPASSISEWSSASSTTSSVVNQRSNNSRTSLDTSSCRSVDGDKIHLDPRKSLAGQKDERQGNKGVSSNTSKKSSTESGNLQAPAKPSGLRLPSPKIGFFDGSSSRTPNGNQHSQSSLHSGLPKNVIATSTPTRSSNGKLKSAKVPTAKMTSLSNMKSGSPKAASPASSPEKSHALVKTSTASMDANDLSSMSFGDRGCETGEACQTAVEVKTENCDKQVVNEHTGAADKDNLDNLTFNENMSSGDVKRDAGESSLSNMKSGSPKAASSASSQEKLHPLVKTSTASLDANDLSSMSFGDRSCETGEARQTTVEVKAENCDTQVVNECTSAVDKDNLGDLTLNENMITGDVKIDAGESSLSDMKSGSPKAESPASSQEKLHPLVKTSTASLDANDLSSMSFGDRSCETGEARQTAVEVKAENCDTEVVNECTSAVDKDNLGDLTLNENMITGDVKIDAGESSLSDMKSGSPKAESPASSQESSHALVKTSTASIDANDLSSMSFGDGGCETGEARQTAVEVKAENRDMQVVNEGTGAVDKYNLGDLTLNDNISSCDVKPDAGEGNYTSGLKYICEASAPTQISTGKLNSSKVSTPRMATCLGSPKVASRVSSQEKSYSSVKTSTVLIDVNDASVLSVGVKGSETGETCQKAVEVEKQVLDAGTGDVNEAKLGEWNGDIKIASSEGICISGSEVGEKNSVSSCEAIEKENNPANCQGQGLIGENRDIYQKNHELNCELVSDMSAAACRPPLAVKNFSSSDECFDISSVLVALPSSEENENH